MKLIDYLKGLFTPTPQLGTFAGLTFGMPRYQTPDGRIWEDSSEARDFSVGNDYYGDDEDELDDALMLFGVDVYGAAKKAGKPAPSKAAKERALRQAALARAAGGFAWPDRGDGSGMRLPLPFGFTLEPGEQRNIPLQPQNDFQVQDIVIASPNAQLCNFNQIKVGTEDQFVSAGPLNGDILSSQTLRNVSLKGTIARPGIIITLAAQNLDTVNSQTFYGALVGPAVRYGNLRAG